MSTKESAAALPPEVVDFIESCRSKPRGESYLIPVLQRVQEVHGYLSRESMDAVSELMQIPSATVTGVASFYHFFTFAPRGECRITVCMGTACFVRGADKVLAQFLGQLGVKEGETTPDGRFSVDCARCIGACALAPVVLVNDQVYGNVKPGDVTRILKEHGFESTSKAEKGA